MINVSPNPNEPNLFIIIEEHTKRVLECAYTESPFVITDAPRRALMGEPAQWLYAALAGHFFNQHPAQASHLSSNAARAHLLANQRQGGGWALACRVVAQWGDYYRPWLAMYIQEDGRVLTKAPEYYQLYNLSGQLLAHTEHFYCEFTENRPNPNERS